MISNNYDDFGTLVFVRLVICSTLYMYLPQLAVITSHSAGKRPLLALLN